MNLEKVLIILKDEKDAEGIRCIRARTNHGGVDVIITAYHHPDGEVDCQVLTRDFTEDNDQIYVTGRLSRGIELHKDRDLVRIIAHEIKDYNDEPIVVVWATGIDQLIEIHFD